MEKIFVYFLIIGLGVNLTVNGQVVQNNNKIIQTNYSEINKPVKLEWNPKMS